MRGAVQLQVESNAKTIMQRKEPAGSGRPGSGCAFRPNDNGLFIRVRLRVCRKQQFLLILPIFFSRSNIMNKSTKDGAILSMILLNHLFTCFSTSSSVILSSSPAYMKSHSPFISARERTSLLFQESDSDSLPWPNLDDSNLIHDSLFERILIP